MKFYVYKLTCDDGGAPFATSDILSLAICKPMMRSTAQVGDIIFGFGSNELSNRLVYIAEVTDKLTDGDYYVRNGQYQNRDDCIYIRDSDNDLIWKKGSKFHKDGSGKARDIGKEPHYKKANVILSRNFVYFGNLNEQGYAIQYPYLRKFVHRLGQGHRVHQLENIQGDLSSLKQRLLDVNTGARKKGEPSHPQNLGLHNEECSGCVIQKNVCRPICK